MASTKIDKYLNNRVLRFLFTPRARNKLRGARLLEESENEIIQHKEDNYIVDLVRSLLSGENNEIMNIIENGIDHGSIVEDLKQIYRSKCEGKDDISEEYLAREVYPELVDRALTLVPKIVRGFLYVPYLKSKEVGELFAVIMKHYKGGVLMKNVLTYDENKIKREIEEFKQAYSNLDYKYIDSMSDSDDDYE
jgi:hypothetical protein